MHNSEKCRFAISNIIIFFLDLYEFVCRYIANAFNIVDAASKNQHMLRINVLNNSCSHGNHACVCAMQLPYCGT